MPCICRRKPCSSMAPGTSKLTHWFCNRCKPKENPQEINLYVPPAVDQNTSQNFVLYPNTDLGERSGMWLCRRCERLCPRCKLTSNDHQLKKQKQQRSKGSAPVKDPLKHLLS